ncbi:MAG TPA: hypothetical protein VHQ90_19320 [Thermoanaerobaculia bacterium]|nr:hypothetical protein [Thermoanaerobaculia bacterium]
MAGFNQSDLEKMLTEFLSCTEKGDDLSPCNVFSGRAVKRAYNITDFENPPGSGKFLSANAIATYVATSNTWVKIGEASDQSTLTQAQAYANQGRAVLAVHPADPHGHVALVLPGALTPSSKWKLKVPNSACFFIGRPKEAYIGKGLGFAFSLPNGVKIYGRESGK